MDSERLFAATCWFEDDESFSEENALIILPAIDLRGGKVVRLEQGDAKRQTVYSDNPLEFALQWQEEGAEELHLVDLDGAFSGKPGNLAIIQQIARELEIPIELGGGMRNRENIESALESGVDRVIIGTKAVDSLDFVGEMVEEFGGSRIAVGIDARNGKVATKGWTENSDWTALELAQAVILAGAETIIYTDIATDGMFTGPNIPSLNELIEHVDCNIIASGGVATKAHIEALAKIPDLYGAIVGKALYDKKVTLAELLEGAER